MSDKRLVSGDRDNGPRPGSVAPEAIPAIASGSGDPATLTDRNAEVLEAYIRLGSYQLVGHELGINAQTAKKHGAAAIARLGVSSIAQACVLYDRTRRSG